MIGNEPYNKERQRSLKKGTKGIKIENQQMEDNESHPWTSDKEGSSIVSHRFSSDTSSDESESENKITTGRMSSKKQSISIEIRPINIK